MANYILQVVLFQLLFLAIYEAFLKRETFFHWNRFYLLFSAVLSYLIPFARIQLFKNYVPEQLAISNLNNLNFTTIATETSSNIVTKTNYFTFENFYYAGVVIMLLLFVVKLLQLFNKILFNKVLRKPNYKLVILKKEDNAFSFMDYIFLGNTLFKKEHQHILQHELVHVKEKHSLDLLFFEIQKILFWFNPLVYVYQYKISVLHEYIADQKTLKTTEKQSFYENLLLQTFAIEKLPFVNQYSKKSLLKKRIIMATKNKSNQLLKMKYLLVLPVILFMLIIASCEDKNDLTQEDIQPFSTIKKVPVFPGCENAETNKEKKKCFTTNMQKFVAENFNTDLAKTLNLSEGMQRIAVQFIIDKQGNATDIKVRAPHPKLKEEVIRVINKLPKMQPAEAENGKKVKVRYNLPIVFKVEDDAKNKNDNNEKTSIDIKKSAIFQICKDLETEEEKRMCFRTELQKFVAENFNMDLTKGLELSNGKQKILTQFKIDNQGNVTDIRARAPHPKLEEEAIRVLQKLPKMQPAEASDGKKVAMRYSLPIIFKVEESNENTSTLQHLKNAKTDLPPTPPSPPKAVNPLQDKKTVFINGKTGETLRLAKDEIKNAWIHAFNKANKVINFKVKVPKKPSYFIKGDKLDNKIHNDILQAKKDDGILIFDIKTQDGTKLNPIQFYVK